MAAGIDVGMAQLSFATLTRSARVVEGQLYMDGTVEKVYGYTVTSFSTAGSVLAPVGHAPIQMRVTLAPPVSEWQTTTSWILREPAHFSNNHAVHYFAIPCQDCDISERGTYTVSVYVDNQLIKVLELESEAPLGQPPASQSQASLTPPPPDGGELSEEMKMIQKMAEQGQKMEENSQPQHDHNDGDSQQDYVTYDSDYS